MRITTATITLIALCLFTATGCHNTAQQGILTEMQAINTARSEKLDTVQEVIQPLKAPEIFETAFHRGTQDTADKLDSFYAVNIGTIQIESGKLIACDPVIMNNAGAFAAVFPRGAYPVQLAIACHKHDQRVAFSRILFSGKQVARWEFALGPGQKPKSIWDTTYYGYGVDAGIGLFIDSVANQEMSKHDKEVDSLFAELNKHQRMSWQYALYHFNKHTVAAFSTGWGDGFYGTYIGYDTSGNICRLLTDFDLVNWHKKPGTTAGL